MISQGLCLLIIHTYVHLQNHKRPSVVIYSISPVEAGQPAPLPGSCLTSFPKNIQCWGFHRLLSLLYLEEWKKNLHVHHSMKRIIPQKCLLREMCLI